MKKLLLLLISTLSFAEVSVFEAGDLDSPHPYGLTKDEKYILKNKKEIEKLKKVIKQQSLIIETQKKELNKLKTSFIEYKQKVDNLAQDVAGIKTILPSFDNNVKEIDLLKKEISSLKQDLNISSINISTLSDSLNELKLVVYQNREKENNDTLKIINLIETLAKEIDSLKVKQHSFKDLKLIDIFKLALKDFKKKNYKKAQEKFYYLYTKKYRLSEVLFYLGEIEYREGNYKEALSFYKNSIKYMKKNSYYTDDLLYHSGYAFEKIKNIEAAKKSYKKLINDFPKSIFFKYAKHRLENLEKNK